MDQTIDLLSFANGGTDNACRSAYLAGLRVNQLTIVLDIASQYGLTFAKYRLRQKVVDPVVGFPCRSLVASNDME